MTFKHLPKITKITTQLLLIALTALFGATSAQAASACKGLAQSKCEASKCTWVKGYQRKDNKKVNGYCRAASGKAKTAADNKKSNKSNTSKAAAKTDNKTSTKTNSKATAKTDSKKTKSTDQKKTTKSKTSDNKKQTTTKSKDSKTKSSK